ncbi:MAG: Na+/H+ antiporter NhaC [Bacteroidetes bacterium]|nr:Na+/H+ antiporter NhaC [Bacteroidota bacterium]
MSHDIKKPSLIQAFIPIVFLIFFLTLNVLFFGDDTLSGANQMALIFASAIAALIAVRLGLNWKSIRKSIVKSINSAMPSILILFLIGSLAGTWMISGVVPAMIYYGLKILNPGIFLFASVVICSIVSLATGSSWSTIATIGIALIGIGSAMGINEGIVAGSIISGAYFGDKMSPMSDTTNLAPAMAGTDLFTHIRYMVLTTAPSMLITLIIFLIIGFTYNFDAVQTNIGEFSSVIETNFNVTPWLFLVPALLIFIIVMKVPPLPSLFAGTLLGGIFAIIFQPAIIQQITDIQGSYMLKSYIAVMKSMFGPVAIITRNEAVNNLLTTNGMAGMLDTIWLIIAAMVFGGAMESAGLLMRITQSVVKFAKSTGSLVASTVATCIFFNITASDQYISIVVPGRMYSKTFRDMGLKPELLSRTLEDAGTVTAPLIPWNTGGATQARVLGVPTLSYLPFAFFNLISPLMSIFMASFNIKIRRLVKDEPDKTLKEEDRKDY